MKIKLPTIILLCISLFFACQKKTDKTEKNTVGEQSLTFAKNSLAGKIISKPEEIFIDLKKGNWQLLDEFIDSVSFIKLETRTDNLIGEISQIIFADSLIFIVDNEIAKSIFVFDMKGHYKYKIGNIGNGPGEYVSIKNITIVPDKNQIAVFDGPKNSIHYFNFNGSFLYSERTSFYVNYLEYLPSGFKASDVTSMSFGNAALEEYRNNTLIVTDTNNIIMYGACHDFYKEGKFNQVMLHSLYNFGNTVYYSPNFSNMIYQVGDSYLTAKYHINIKGGMPPITDDITSDIFDEYSRRYAFFNGEMVEMKDFTYISLFTPQGNPFVIYSHTKKRVYYCRFESMNPAFIFITFPSLKTRYQENTIIASVSAHLVFANKNNLYNNGRARWILDDLYNGLNEDDNPVLFFYHIKNGL